MHRLVRIYLDPERRQQVWTHMNYGPKYPQLANIVFLSKVGETLRQATCEDVPHDELPDDIKHLLRRLERVEERDRRKTSG
jgi:hypothetical protein